MNEKATGTVFRDVLMLAVAGFMVLVLITLPHVNPPDQGKATGDPPGNVMVEMRWPDKMDVDIDLWVQAPGDVPVGYSNMSGLLTNLLRDDLGAFNDPLELNYENVFIRGVPPGEYVVNVHFFRNQAQVSEVPVTVQASVKPNRGKMTPIVFSRVKLIFEGQELTVFRFTLTRDGTLVPGSINSLQKDLRAAVIK